MSKVTKKDRIAHLELQVTWLTDAVHELQGTENIEGEPQLKQLDQSVFNGLDEKWRFAAVDGSKGFPVVYEFKPYAFDSGKHYTNRHGLYKDLTHLTGYDTTDWQNSLIERDKAELTGSDLCRAMLERGDRFVMCMVDDGVDVIHDLACFVSSTHPYIGRLDNYKAVTPTNNQGEPLTQSEVGL